MELTIRPITENGLRPSSLHFFKVKKSEYAGIRSGIRKPLSKFEAKEKELKAINNTFSCSNSESLKISDFWHQPSFEKKCTSCASKWSSCYNCVINCNNDEKRQLYIALQQFGIKSLLKHRINKNGSIYASPQAIDFDQILAIPDLYIDLGIKKVCIFIESEIGYKALKSKSVRNTLKDHSLQKLGFQVYRCTTSEIEQDCDLVLQNITDKILKKHNAISPRMKRLQKILG